MDKIHFGILLCGSFAAFTGSAGKHAWGVSIRWTIYVRTVLGEACL